VPSLLHTIRLLTPALTALVTSASAQPADPTDSVVRIAVITKTGTKEQCGVVTPQGRVITSWLFDDRGLTNVEVVTRDGAHHPTQGVISYAEGGRILLLAVDWAGKQPPPATFVPKVVAPILAATISRGRAGADPAETADIEVLSVQRSSMKINPRGKVIAAKWLGSPILDPQGHVAGILTGFSMGASLGGPMGVNIDLSDTGTRAELVCSLTELDVIPWKDWPDLSLRLQESKRLTDESLRLAKAGNILEARAKADEAVSHDPRSVRALETQISCMISEQRSDRAIASCTRAAALDPTDGLPHMQMAAALLGLHRIDEALQSAERAIDIEPTNAKGYAAKAHILEDSGRRTEAISAYRKAVQLDPKDQSSWDQLEKLKRRQ
jgi:hypothetical protein